MRSSQTNYLRTLLAIGVAFTLIASIPAASLAVSTTHTNTPTLSIDGVSSTEPVDGGDTSPTVIWERENDSLQFWIVPEQNYRGSVDVQLTLHSDNTTLHKSTLTRKIGDSLDAEATIYKAQAVPLSEIPDDGVQGNVLIQSNATSNSKSFNIEDAHPNPGTAKTRNGSLKLASDGIDIDTYPADYTIPSNSFRVYYSNDADQDLNETTDEEYDDIDLSDVSMPGPDEDIEPDSDLPGEWAVYEDIPFDTAAGIPGINNVTWAEYQQNQLEHVPHENDTSLVVPANGSELREDGVIKDAHTAVIGTLPGVNPYMEDMEPMAPTNGSATTFLDYRLDESVLPDDKTYEPVNNSNPAATPNWGSGLVRQTQVKKTRQVENHSVTRAIYIDHPGVYNYTFLARVNGSGGQAIPYTVNNTSEQVLKFKENSIIKAESTRYDWFRTRDRGYNERTVDISGTSEETFSRSESVDGTITGSGHECTYEDAGSEDETETHEITVTKTFDWEREVTREFTFSVTDTKSVSASGYICGDIPENESSKDITGTVSGSADYDVSYSGERTVQYEWWKDWEDWNKTDTETIRNDMVFVTDSKNFNLMNTNDIDVEQTAVQVGPNNYHTFLDIEYEDEGTGDVSEEELRKRYLWSRLYFGNKTYVQSDWQLYSETDFHTGTLLDGEDESSGTDGEQINIPHQLRLQLVNTADGPSIYTESGRAPAQTQQSLADQPGQLSDSPTIIGFTRRNATVATEEPRENVNISTASTPAVYERFAVKNTPAPATSIIGINGEEINVTTNDVIPYEKPQVNLGYDSSSGDVTVTVMNATNTSNVTPLKGREVYISTQTESYGPLVTNESGQVVVNIGEDAGATRLTATVQGDTWESVMENSTDPESEFSDKDVFWGTVTVQKTVGMVPIAEYFIGVFKSLFLAIPLVYLYVLWRDAGIGK